MLDLLETNQQIGDFEVVEILGRGPCGTTYHVVQQSTGKEFAMKLFSIFPGVSNDWKERFYAQSALLRQVTHKNCDSIFSFGESEHYLYYLKDFVHDESGKSINLTQYKQKHGGVLSEYQLFHSLYQIVQALDYLWNDTEGIAHGSLKDTNILIAHPPDPFSRELPFEVKVTDFQPYQLFSRTFCREYYHWIKEQTGKKRVWKEEEVFNELTFHQLHAYDWHPPEAELSFSSDLFSLGVLYYYMITDSFPQGRFLSPTELKPGLNSFWNHFIQKTLAYHPKDRYSSYDQLLDDIKENLEEVETNERPIERAPILRKSLTPPGMLYIPPGKFEVGSSECGTDASPPYSCQTEGFYLERTPVTVAKFQRFIEETSYCTEVEKEGKGTLFMNGDWKEVEGIYWKNPLGITLPVDFKEHPVTQVTYNDALAYCEWLGHRLPTEEEWEYSAKGGLYKVAYPWGSTITKVQANFASKGTTPVMRYQANAYGLYDIVGNVWEWTTSWYKPYPGSEEKQPYYGEEYKVLRGGAWQFDASQCHVSYRNANRPEYTYPTIGFRTVCDFKKIGVI